MINIVIADDHVLIREGFKKLISLETDMQVVAEAQNGFEVLSFFEKNACDVLVLDINMPEKNGLEVLVEMKELHPDVKILILSMNPEDRFAVRALKMGASGYLTKESAGDELINAIRKVHSGRKYITPELAEILADELDSDSGKSINEILSDREFQVFVLLASGKSVSEIVENMSISLSTVNTYRKRIMDKMGFKSNAEIIRYGLKTKLVD